MTLGDEGSTMDMAHLEAALGYLRRRWAVIPAGERAKRPIVPWQRFEHDLPTEPQVLEWFERWPKANLAVVTGAVSGIVVVDVDAQHRGAQSLASLEARHGALPRTVEAITGGGGRHIYFVHPGREVRNRTGLAPGIDLRGDGGCIIVPPSVHPSGKRYRWRPGHAPGQVAMAEMPVWLGQPRLGLADAGGHPIAYWRALVSEGVEEGARNATIASFAGHLLWHGVDPDVAMELMLSWNRVRCHPPLADDEVIRTVRSIERTRHHHRDMPVDK
jgi:hypothetical protein